MADLYFAIWLKGTMKNDIYLVCFAVYFGGFVHCHFIMLNEASKSLLGFEGR